MKVQVWPHRVNPIASSETEISLKKICRYKNLQNEVRVGLAVDGDRLKDLTATGCSSLESLIEADDCLTEIEKYAASAPEVAVGNVTFLSPVEKQEVWASGVTYMRSKTARMEESDFSATAYDLVYEADRPEIFFKSVAEKVVGPLEPVGIRKDAKWNVPEPELALVISSKGKIVGYTVGNDMSSRDIEGENLLYLPQAKVYDKACAAGPFVVVGPTEAEVREWTVALDIQRGGKSVFNGETLISQLKRTLSELCDYLYRSQTFPHGALLLTGTGVVPNDDFTLNAGDVVRITISGIGTLENPVEVV